MLLSVIAGYVFQQIGLVLVIEVGVSFFLYAKIHENTREPNEFILRLL